MQFDLITVGGGASGTAVLQALAQRRGLGPLRIAVVERSDTPGPGLPYGEASEPFHTMGRTRTLRREKGLQLRQRFADSLQRLRSQGVEVRVLCATEVRSVVRAGAEWIVSLGRESLRAPRVVLATGHWHVPRLEQLSRAVDWRWDVRRLHAAIEDHEDVVILGMGQSGLDVATSLAARKRTGRIRLASRLGVLPAVFGHVGGRGLQLRALESLVRAPAVTLDALIAAVREGAGGALPEWSEAALKQSVTSVPGPELLRREVAQARESLAQTRALPWQPVLWHGMELFHELLPRLSAEDRLRLAANWTPLLRHAEAIHLEAASRMLELIDQGVVEVHALGADPQVGEDRAGVWARGSRGEVRGARVIDARGPDPRLALSDDALLKSLLEAGVVTAGRVPFSKSPTEGALPEGWSIEDRWLVTGGLWVDPESFEALDAAGEKHGLYAMGPLTIGQFPFYAGLWATRRAAERIVATL